MTTAFISGSRTDLDKLRDAVVRLLEEGVATEARTGRGGPALILSYESGKTAVVWLYLQAYTEERVPSLPSDVLELLRSKEKWASVFDDEVFQRLRKILGGAQTQRNALVHGLQQTGAPKTVESVREGYRTRVGQVFSDILEIQSTDLLARLGIPKRTAERRLTQERFSADESDRLYRAMDVTRYAVEVFGDADTAAAWIKEPNPALGGVTPLSLLDTEPGTTKVREVLTRIEYGVYS